MDGEDKTGRALQNSRRVTHRLYVPSIKIQFYTCQTTLRFLGGIKAITLNDPHNEGFCQIYAMGSAVVVN